MVDLHHELHENAHFFNHGDLSICELFSFTFSDTNLIVAVAAASYTGLYDSSTLDVPLKSGGSFTIGFSNSAYPAVSFSVANGLGVEGSPVHRVGQLVAY